MKATTMALKPNASDVDNIMIVDKPAIYVTSWDYNRLWNVVEAFRPRGAAPLVDLLAEELDRAEIVEPAAIPHDVVTMHSCVSFVDNDTDQVRTVTLVYPGEEDSKRDRIAVSTPVGSALLGLRSGATMAWRTLDGRTKRLTVLDVQHQPEAKGFDGASGPDDRGSPHSGTPIPA